MLIPASCGKDQDTEDIGLQPGEVICKDMYFADPSAHVFNDTLYIYPSHDRESGIEPNSAADHYAMEDYHVLSIDSFKKGCTDHGMVLHVDDIPWAKRQLWAPDAAHRDGTYYLYFPAKDKDDIFRIGVATSPNPTGPFIAEEHYIEGSFSMDPAVFIDTDGTPYMYFGGIWGGQLERWQSGTYDPNAKGPSGEEPALGPQIAVLTDDMLSFKEAPREVSILDENGDPIVASDDARRFFEAVWVHKHKDTYYLSYSTGNTHLLVYAVGKSPRGPFTYKGKLMDPVQGWTTHHSIVKYRKKWYLFYHDASISGVDHLRSLKFREISYTRKGEIIVH